MKVISKRKRRKIFFMIVVIAITTVVLIVETYAWFAGLSTVNTSEFSVSVSSAGGLELSLDGENWKSGNTSLTISQGSVTATTGLGSHAYSGHTNKWPTNGMTPVSTPGTLDTAVSRLILYEKSSLSASPGGYRIVADRVDNYTVTNNTLVSEAEGYVAFDLFIRNGTGNEYSSESTESVYMMPNPTASVNGATNYGAANSLRVGFFVIGSMKARGADLSYVRGIKCTGNPTAANVSVKCTGGSRSGTWNIWEPNETSHTSQLVNYYSSICKKRNADGTYTSTPCNALSTTMAATPTYYINDVITASDNVDIYDGNVRNNYTVSTTNNKLVALGTFTDAKANSNDANRESLLKIPGNSICKVRVYIWLEGQDVDNYDVVTKNSQINIGFGLTKDRFGINTASSTS